MASITYQKVKSVAKEITTGDSLEKIILKTMKEISRIVGATLGPGGRPVIVERQEVGMADMITKDGVTVFRSLGFENPTAHAVMEAARDASVRTVSEAGDGTTTATVLSEAFVRCTAEYLKKNPKSSPQKVVRIIQKAFKDIIEPDIREIAFKVDDKTKRSVALCSSNGDTELTESVLKCFDITGDEGNITILEEGGPSGYSVQQLKGYPVGMGYEECCRRFFPAFVNDKANNRCYLEKPVFILYFGTLTEVQTLYGIMESIGGAWEKDKTSPVNVVICAMGFSENVLATLAANFPNPETLNIFPLVIPKNAVHNSELYFLQDIQSVSGADIFDPLSRPLEKGGLENVGQPLEYFECSRYRANVVGIADESLLMCRIDELKIQLEAPESIYEKIMLEDRIAKLTGGIAKLTVFGSSSGEIREKRDRAEDAVCAIRGAIKHGALPGGGWTLVYLIQSLSAFADSDGVSKEERDVIEDVLMRALFEPINRLMSNAGLNEEEVTARYGQLIKKMYEAQMKPYEAEVWDGVDDRFVSAVESGIVDSVPAVLEAIRNSISIATLLGTLGGCVVFRRDKEVDRQDASDAYQYLANSIQKDNG